MADYTMTIKEITESKINIFNFDYPIFDESYRPILEEKIIRHYYFREIGFETIGRFIYELRTKLNEIMPFYNKYFMAMNLEQRILDNYDVTETFEKSTDNTGTANNNNKNMYSDTPQGRLDLTGDNSKYLSELTENKGSVTTIDNGTENWVRKMTGNIGVQTDADAVNKYISSLINVDMLIINELNELFMGVF